MNDATLLLVGSIILNIYTIAAVMLDLPLLIICTLGFGGLALTAGAIHTMIFYRDLTK